MRSSGPSTGNTVFLRRIHHQIDPIESERMQKNFSLVEAKRKSSNKYCMIRSDHWISNNEASFEIENSPISHFCSGEEEEGAKIAVIYNRCTGNTLVIEKIAAGRENWALISRSRTVDWELAQNSVEFFVDEVSDEIQWTEHWQHCFSAADSSSDWSNQIRENAEEFFISWKEAKIEQ